MELDLGTERGRVVWEVLVRESTARPWEFYGDAQNGQILRRQRD